MSADLIADITDAVRRAAHDDMGLDAVLKIDFKGEGVIVIDGRSTPNRVLTEDAPADCTVIATPQTLMKVKRKELDPALAYMTGRIKVKGDSAVVFRLAPLLQKLDLG